MLTSLTVNKLISGHLVGGKKLQCFRLWFWVNKISSCTKLHQAAPGCARRCKAVSGKAKSRKDLRSCSRLSQDAKASGGLTEFACTVHGHDDEALCSISSWMHRWCMLHIWTHTHITSHCNISSYFQPSFLEFSSAGTEKWSLIPLCVFVSFPFSLAASDHSFMHPNRQTLCVHGGNCSIRPPLQIITHPAVYKRDSNVCMRAGGDNINLLIVAAQSVKESSNMRKAQKWITMVSASSIEKWLCRTVLARYVLIELCTTFRNFFRLYNFWSCSAWFETA